MVQVLESNKKPSFGQKIMSGVEPLVSGLQQYAQQQNAVKAAEKLGIDPSILQLPKEAQAEYFKNQFGREKGLNPLQQSQLNLNEEKLNALKGQEQLFNQLNPQQKASQENINEQELSPKNEGGLKNASEEILRKISAFAGQPGKPGIIGNMAQAELDAREKKLTVSDKKEAALRSETLPIRTELADRGESARKGIESKENLLKIIDTGKLDDPTVATLLDNLPFKLGQRMLSPETVEYKGGLVDNYGDLRTLFQGATRVKEIEILENKIADIYLTDQQKKRILESRINAHKADIIRAEAAAELEEQGKFYGVGKFRQEVEKKSKPKLDALFNKILDEQQAIIKDAENAKKIPLDINDPDNLQVINQIYNEAGKNWKKAEELAKKKGYSW